MMPTDLESIVARLDAGNGPFIDGAFMSRTSAGSTPHVDPNSGLAVSTAHVGGAAEIDAAVAVQPGGAENLGRAACQPSRRDPSPFRGPDPARRGGAL